MADLPSDGVVDATTEAVATSGSTVNEEDYAWDYPQVYYDMLREPYAVVKTLAPVILVVGTVGNILSVAVMQRRNFRSTTTSLYLTVLALVDIACLYEGLLYYWIYYTFDFYDLRLISPGLCKLHVFFEYALPQFEYWILVSVSLERMAAIYYPLKAKEMFSKRRAVAGLLTVAAIIILVNMHFFFYTHIEEMGQAMPKCQVAEGSPVFYFDRYVYTWIDWGIVFLAIVVLVVSTVAIVVRLASIRRRKKALKNTAVAASSGQGKIDSVTVMLVVSSTVFIIFNLPMYAFCIGYWYWYYDALDNEDYVAFARVEIGWALLQLYWNCNFALNFFTYVLGGARFRRELRDLLCRSANSRVGPGVSQDHSLQRTNNTTGNKRDVSATQTESLQRVNVIDVKDN